MRIRRQPARDQFSRGWVGQEWLYPAPRFNQASATMPSTMSTPTGFESPMASGTGVTILDSGVYAVQMGGGNNDMSMNMTTAGQVQLAKLPADHVLEDFRRVHWWRWRQRLTGPAGLARLFCTVNLFGNQTGTGFYNANTGLHTGHGIGIDLNGAGTWQFSRKASAAANAVQDEELTLVWPRALDLWTEVWFVILGATATKRAKFRLYLEGDLTLEREWGDNGESNGGNPILESGATAFSWHARCNADAVTGFPGLLLKIAGWRYRQGFYDVDGAELNGK